MKLLKSSIVAATLLASTTASFAAGFDNLVLSAEEGSEENTTTFPTDTAKIFLSGEITDDVASGSKITVTWVAVDSKGVAPPNFKIDSATFDVGSLDNHLDASLSKPNNGFPAGDYQVQIDVDGKTEETVNFKVQ